LKQEKTEGMLTERYFFFLAGFFAGAFAPFLGAATLDFLAGFFATAGFLGLGFGFPFPAPGAMRKDSCGVDVSGSTMVF
jgi:hypothetical protein